MGCLPRTKVFGWHRILVLFINILMNLGMNVELIPQLGLAACCFWVGRLDSEDEFVIFAHHDQSRNLPW